jgi:hypothetical protein
MSLAILAFSLSLESRIKTYGAYAGFAAIIGLAILSVLYFAQAREVKRLREWAGRGPERAAESGARLAADPQKRVVAEPLTRPEPVTAAGQSTPPPSPLIPSTMAAQEAIPTTTEGDSGTAADATATPDPGAEDATGVPETSGDAAAATPPAGAPGDSEQTSTAMAPVPASARVRASATPAPPTSRRAAAAAGSGDGDGDGRSPMRKRLLIGAGVLALVIVIVIVATSLGGSDNKAAPNTVASTPTPTPITATSGKHTTTTTKKAPARSSISVGVLNGTTVNGLARTVGDKLSGAGFQVPKASEKNASDSTHASTIVAYSSGQRASGLAVAKTLGLGSDSLTALDQDTSVVAGSGLTVVVTVGADLSN